MNPFDMLEHHRKECDRRHDPESDHDIVEVAVMVQIIVDRNEYNIHHHHFPQLKPAVKRIIGIRERRNAQEKIDQIELTPRIRENFIFSMQDAHSDNHRKGNQIKAFFCPNRNVHTGELCQKSFSHLPDKECEMRCALQKLHHV